MINLSNITAGLVLGLVVTSAVPAFAAGKLNHTARDARAQAYEQTVEGVSAHRAAALRECVERGGKLLQKDWGVRQSEVEAACMAEHGEPQ